MAGVPARREREPRTCSIRRTSGRSSPGRTPSPIALRVADVEAARRELEAKGVVFAGDTFDTGVCHMAHFSDPDGNVFMLHRRYAPA